MTVIILLNAAKSVVFKPSVISYAPMHSQALFLCHSRGFIAHSMNLVLQATTTTDTTCMHPDLYCFSKILQQPSD